mgnify:CR=1 FL=1
MTLADLRALCGRATPGPWRVGSPDYRCVKHDAPHPGEKSGCEYTFQGWYGGDYFDRHVSTVTPPAELIGSTESGPMLTQDDADFIAAARTWLPALIEVAEAAQKMNECVPGTSSFAKHFVTARKALAQLDEVGRTG